MFKKLFNKFKKNNTQKNDEKTIQEINDKVDIQESVGEDSTTVAENTDINNEENVVEEIKIEEENEDEIVFSIEESINHLGEELESDKLDEDIVITEDILKEDIETDVIKEESIEDINDNSENEESAEEDKSNSEIEGISEDDEEYIKEIKINRGKSIKAIDVYTEEVKIFKTHIECSKELKLPLEYIKENLKYGYTDYFGKAINYLQKELNVEEDNYLDNNKSPVEIFNNLNNKIFTSKISEDKIDEILGSDKIEPVKMHYRFECIDEEYDEYFKKYKSIIKRGGKKKIELVNKKGEVIEIFKSLDDCATYLGKEKEEIVNMLKYFNTKVGRNEIRYSLRNI